MSVSFFDAKELGNVAMALTLRGADAHALATDLAEISAANIWTFNRRYGDDMKPVTVGEILKAMAANKNPDADRAKASVSLFDYNGPAGEGWEAEYGNIPFYNFTVALRAVTGLAARL